MPSSSEIKSKRLSSKSYIRFKPEWVIESLAKIIFTEALEANTRLSSNCYSFRRNTNKLLTIAIKYQTC